MLTPTFIQCFHYAEKPFNSDELIKTRDCKQIGAGYI